MRRTPRHISSGRRAGGSGIYVFVSILLAVTACGGTETDLDLSGRQPDSAVAAFVAAQLDGERRTYVAASGDAAAELGRAVRALGEGRRDQAERLAAAHAYAVVELSGALALVPRDLPDERGWGLYVVRPGGRDLAVEVPHPRADLDTERLGVELAQAAEARYLLVAGAHRDAGDGAADPSRDGDGVFTAVHAALARAGVPALQLHGYAADSLTGVDMVVSPGAAEVTPLARRTADRGEAAGYAVCRAWQERCGQLEGRRNAQGRVSAEVGATFVHLELTRDLRRDGGRRTVVAVLQEALAL